VIENPFDIKNPFFGFKLCLETIVNGKVTKGPFLCQPHQRVKVLYKLEERKEGYHQLLQEYQEMLRDSKLYLSPDEIDEFEEED
jgi:DNA-binding transcriptional regulator PaaX